MKKIIIALFIAFLALNNVNAQKCKPKVKSVDDFTNVETEFWGSSLTSMSVYSLNVKYLPTMFAFKQDGKYLLTIGLNIDGMLTRDLTLNDHVWFEKGSKIYLKLENEVLVFEIKESLVRTNLVSLVALVSKDDLIKITNQKLLKVKILPFLNSEDFVFVFSVSKGRDKKLKSQFKCLLNE